MRPHVRIEKPSRMRGGAWQVVRNDRVFAVGEDGTEVDISHGVTEWREIAKVGEPRRVEVVLLGYVVVQQDDGAKRRPEAEATK